MKILQLSTHDLHGGAALAASRLHRALRGMGAECRMLVRTRQTDDASVAATDDGTLAAWHERIATPWLQQRLPAGSSWFTAGCLNAFVENHPWVMEADVLHLHWVAEWLSAEAVARLAALGKPMFWTLHDLWPVTGGNHYAGSNAPEGEAWQTGAAMPEELRGIAGREFDRKFQLLRGLPWHAISPSRWLAQVVGRSRIGGGWKMEVQPNGIATELFVSGERSAARGRWEVPAEKVMLLFGCQALEERRKGFPELREALRVAAQDPAFASMAREGRVVLGIFGADKPVLDDLPVPVRHFGVVATERDMASLYQAADAFLCPALEDNLPTTVIESLSCQTPVLGFATGGVPDLVRHEDNGILAPCGDVSGLAAGIVRFTTDAALRRKLQAGASQSDPSAFSTETQARRVMALYESAVREVTPASGRRLVIAAPPVPPICSPVQGEESWLVNAAAEAVAQAAQRDRLLRQKIDEMKVKISQLKTELALSKSKPQKEAGWFQRWRRQ